MGMAPDQLVRWRRYAAVALLLLIFGAVRVPVETRLTAEHRAAYFGTVKLNLALREKIGQLGFLAALSGFRSLVADLLWIDANTAWEQVAWGRMHFLLDTVTTLAPRNVNFWEMSAWHMAYNASVSALENRKEPKIALRLRAQHEYFMLGKDYDERGIQNNPDSWELHQSLANIYKYKLGDHCAAWAEFDKVVACPHPPTYAKRFAAYELCKCPGHEREAYERLRALYLKGPQERLPTLLDQLKDLQEKLGVPAEQRVYKAQ